ncbi:glycoside hydrolase family 57 [bacterium]|nr:glycoside hydrolase family 57 [bacterium]
MKKIFHALGLHMHQPPDNLRLLLDTNNWEARQIACCYERPVRYAQRFADVAYLNIGFSGILLEQIADPQIQKEFKQMCDLEAALDQYRKCRNIEIIGMGYYHPIFPLIPVEDWASHLEMGRRMAKDIFGVEPSGFWPSEMAFSMEMIPALKQAGYEYVVVDSVHIRHEDVDDRKADKYKDFGYMPYKARHGGYEIVVVPRSRDISNAQESGLDQSWFENEVISKTASVKGLALVTTWSDGENGGWFRQMDEGSGFWGHFFAPYMERVRSEDFPIKPVRISDFINEYPPEGYVFVQTGAWNVGNTSGFDFSQWSGSSSQKRAFEEIWGLSREFHRIEKEVEDRINEIKNPYQARSLLSKAHNWLLRAETSCFFFWGDAWISKVYDQTKPARILLRQIGEMLA